MTASRYTIVTTDTHPEREITLARAAELTGLHPEMILEFVRADLIRVHARDPEGLPRFNEFEITRLRHIEYLRRRERASLHTVRYIFHLLDRLEATERELRSLRERIR